jgi:hypothetical protein
MNSTHCQQAELWLDAYVDGELGHDEQRILENHLSVCASCRGHLAALRRISEHAQAALQEDQIPAPDDLTAKVLASMQKAPAPPINRFAAWPKRFWGLLESLFVPHGNGPRVLRWSLGLGAVALILFTAYVFDLENRVGQRQTYVLGQSAWRWGAPASLRVLALSNAQSGTPLVNAPVTIEARSQRGGWHTLFEGRSDEHGTVAARFRLPSELQGAASLRVSTGSWWSRDKIEKPITIERRAKILLTSDKPLYQPGQTIHLRALAMWNGAGTPAAGEKLALEIKDPKGTRVWKNELTASRFGVASADFQLASEVLHGAYNIKATLGEDVTEKTVMVKPYVLPKFKVRLKPEQSFYTPGALLRGSLESRYFFGKPVVNGDASLELAAFDITWHVFARLQGKTDAQGRWDFTATLPKVFAGQPLARGNALVKLTAAVTDKAGQRESISEPIPVAAQPLQIGIMPESGTPAWGLENVLYIVTSYPDGAPAPSRGTVVVNGTALPFTTDETGIGSVKIFMDEGGVQLQVVAADARGRRATANRQFLTNGIGEASDAVLLRTDKAIYDAGNTIRLTALTSRTTGTVYFDILRDGQTVLTQSAPVEQGSAQLTLDLDAEMVGALQINAYFLNNQWSMTRDTKLVLVRPAPGLNVQVAPSKAVFRPGEEGRLDVTLKDSGGKGVAGAVGLAIVDESVFALREQDPGLAATYFAMEAAILAPRFQSKFAPGALWGDNRGNQQSSSALQRSAGVALTSLMQATPEQSPEGNDEQHLRLARYDLSGDSLPLRQKAAQEFRESYFRSLYVVFLVLSLAAPGLVLSKKQPAALVIWLPLMMLSLAIGWNATEPGLLFGIASLVAAYLIHRFWSDMFLEFITLGVLTLLVTVIVLSLMGRRISNTFNAAAMQMSDSVEVAAGVAPSSGRPTQARIISAGKSNEGAEATSPEPPRLREYFPETMLWQPEIITDDNGQAQITLPMADSITDWRITAQANDDQGRFGSSTGALRVFQEFFIDPQLPVALTQGDWITIPVAVHNYLPQAQKITVQLAGDRGWFAISGPTVQTLTVAPRDVAVVRFPIRALRFGRHRLALEARGAKSTASDAIVREIEVMPDGQEISATQSDRLTSNRMLPVSMDANAIDGTQKLLLQIHPGTFSQVVNGLDALLQVPYGCFEQTSSVTYPNILILDYLKRSGRATPQAQMKAESFISLGYQRILTFETPGGGFDWFGSPPAKTVLTALGVMQLSDMARVAPVDENLIRRAIRVLLQRQRTDGSWNETLHSHIMSGVTDDTTVTAYVTWALASAKSDEIGVQEAIDKGLNYLQSRLGEKSDAYTLALAANAFATVQPRTANTRRLMDWLLARGEQKDDVWRWTPARPTVTYGRGDSGAQETTALCALAFLQTETHAEAAQGALKALVQDRAPGGAWSSTQATILALRALVGASDGVEKGEATIRVLVNNQRAATLQINAGNFDVMQQVDLTPYLQGRNATNNTIRLEKDGALQPFYQLTTRAFVPWSTVKAPAKPEVQIAVTYDHKKLRQNEEVTAQVTIRSRSKRDLPMLLVDVGLAPGFEVQPESLELLKRQKRIEKWEVTPRQLILYLRGLKGGAAMQLPVRLRARFPVRAQTPPSQVYEYYNPANRALSRPYAVIVTA